MWCLKHNIVYCSEVSKTAIETHLCEFHTPMAQKFSLWTAPFSVQSLCTVINIPLIIIIHGTKLLLVTTHCVMMGHACSCVFSIYLLQGRSVVHSYCKGIHLQSPHMHIDTCQHFLIVHHWWWEWSLHLWCSYWRMQGRRRAKNNRREGVDSSTYGL